MFNFKKVVSIIVIFSFVLGACSSKQIQREQEELEEQERAEAKRQEQQPAGSISQLPLLPDDKRTNEQLSKQAEELLEKYKGILPPLDTLPQDRRLIERVQMLMEVREILEKYKGTLPSTLVSLDALSRTKRRGEKLTREEQEAKERKRELEQSLRPFTNQHPNINIPGAFKKSSSLKIWLKTIKIQELLIDGDIELLEFKEAEAEYVAKTVELAQAWPMTQIKLMRVITDPIYDRINKASENKRLAISRSERAQLWTEIAQKREKGLLLLAEKGLSGGEVEPDGMRDNAWKQAITEQYLAQKYKELWEKWQKLTIGWGEVKEQEEKTLKASKSLKPADNGNQGLELLSPEKRVMNIKILESLVDKEIKLLEFEEVKAKKAAEKVKSVRRGPEALAGWSVANKRSINARENKNMAERVRDLLLAIEAAAPGEVEPDVAQKEKEIAQKKHELAIRWGEVKEQEEKTRDAMSKLLN